MLEKLRPVDRDLTPEEVETGLKYVVRDGMASQALASLTGSAFIVALALHLGASNVLIGVLAAIPQLSQLLQLPSVLLVRRIRNRRLISVTASAIGRMSWLAIALLPLVIPSVYALAVLTLGLVVASAAAAVSNCGWNSWMQELVPENRLGQFFGRRFAMATTTGAVVSLIAALFLDWIAPNWLGDITQGYAIVFGLGFCFGALGVFYVSRIPEPLMQPEEGSLRTIFARPYRDPNFRNLVRFLGTWNFALYLASPFFTVYMLQRLRMDLAVVIGLIVLGRAVNIVFLRLWGSFSDRISNTSVLAVAVPMSLLGIFAWTFTTFPEVHAFTLPLLVLIHVVMGVAMAGITLATGNIGLKLAPKGEGTTYLAAASFVSAAAAGLAPILGGRMADFFVERKLIWTLEWVEPGRTLSLPIMDFQQWDFLFLIAVVAGLYALHRLAMIREVGEVEERVVVYELVAALGRELRDFSTVAVIRNLVSVGRLAARRPHRSGGAETGANGGPEEVEPPDERR